MKKKLFVSAMLVCLLALGLVLIGCPTDSDDGGGGGGLVPAELQGHWLRDSDGTERYLSITSSGWGRDSDAFEDGEASWVITKVENNKVEYQHHYYPQVDTTGSFEYSISGTTLTISNSSGQYLSSGTYTKQP